jgi:anthranilate 1,2-dioxygenase small subunit
VVRIMQNGDTLLFASGRYVDRISLRPEPRYAERVVICDSRRFDTLLAIPL